jgi:hypothetical protein
VVSTPTLTWADTLEDMDFLYVEVRRLEIAMQRVVPTASDADGNEGFDAGGPGGGAHWE